MDFLFICNSVLLGAGLAMDAFSVSVANGLNEPDMSQTRMTGIAGVYAGFQFLMPITGWFCVRMAAAKFQAFAQWVPLIALILLLYIGGSMLWEGLSDWKEKRETSCPDPSGSGLADPEGEKNKNRFDERSRKEELETECSGNVSGRKTYENNYICQKDWVRYEKEATDRKTDAGNRIPIGTLLLQGVATSIDALSVGFTISDYGRDMAIICCLIIAAVTFGICMSGLLFGKRFGTRLEKKAPVLGGTILILIGVEIFVKGWFGL